MLDVFNIPTSTGGSVVQVFNSPSTVLGAQFDTWLKPRGKTMCHIICTGGGGGGGGGFTRAAGNNGGGGGGGGSSAITRITLPLFLLPDVLYVSVGAGGQGVSSGGGTAGSAIASVVSIQPNATTTNILAYSGSAAGGGGTGTTAAAGAAGSAGSASSAVAMPLCGVGIFLAIAGQAGIIGGAVNVAGGSQTIPATSLLNTGGAGGAGVTATDLAGGGFTAIATSWLSEQRPTTPTAGSVNGSGGIDLWNPMFSFGGCGGSSSNAGIGGNGGNGGYGCGGGGGGAGTTGGRGGNGGSGRVVIICW